MKNEDIKKNLFAAVSEMIPEDEYERITARLSSAPNLGKAGIEMTDKKQNSKVINFKKIAGVAVAAVVAIAVGLFGFNYYNSNFAVASIIDIDVNPSIELTANQKDVVLGVEPVNIDAKDVIGDMDLRGTNVDIAVNAIIGAMVKNGYLKGQDNEILITVKNDDKAHADELQKRIEDDVDSVLSSHNVDSAIINQTIAKEDKLTEAEEFAKEQGISVGKANFVLKLAEKDNTLKAEELAKSSLKDIATIVAEKKIDISDIADHDPDDSIWENIAESVEDVNEQVQDNTQSESNKRNVMSEKTAKRFALQDAGLEESEVTLVKAELEVENGREVYDIEFYLDGTEYDYEIDARTGGIISSDLDIEDYTIPQKNDNKVESKVESKPANQNQKHISVADAKKSAIKHSGVNSADVQFTKAKFDYDDGRQIYDVEFNARGFEYDYEIDAFSGEVLKSDKERDDDYVAPVESKAESKPESQNKSISESAAKKAALKHAGVSSSAATFVKVKLDYDDGVKVYEVDFRAKGYEYDYEIDALSGEILKSDKEKDDDYVAPVTSKPKTTKISSSAAKKAALGHAGVKEADTYDLSVEYDNDDGVKLYEVEFKSGKYEYSYEIDALSGKVLSREKEVDD